MMIDNKMLKSQIRKCERGVCVQVGLVAVVTLMAVVCVAQLLRLSTGSVEENLARDRLVKRQVDNNYPVLDLPMYIRELMPVPDVKNISLQIEVTRGYRTFDTKSKQYWVYAREALPLGFDNETTSKQDILLLHGARYSSKTWEDLGTMNLLAALGYRVVAIDLPGYGRTLPIDVPDRVEFIEGIISEFQLNMPVLVTPSMSGRYALPYVFDNEFPHVNAMVTLAPVYTNEYSRDTYKNFMIPTLVIYGEDDLDIGLTGVLNLAFIGNLYAYMMPNGRHAFYIPQKSTFHMILYNFLDALTRN